MTFVLRFCHQFPWGKVLLLWALVIFYFSSLAGSPYPLEVTSSYYIERKGAHVFEYAILAVLLVGFLRRFFRQAHFWEVALLSLFLSGFYGVTDELHQYFVPYRGAKLSDVGIDILGAFFGLSIASLLRHLFLRKK